MDGSENRGHWHDPEVAATVVAETVIADAHRIVSVSLMACHIAEVICEDARKLRSERHHPRQLPESGRAGAS